MTRTRQARSAYRTLLRLTVVTLLVSLPGLRFVPDCAAAETTRLTVTARIATFFRMQVNFQAAALTITAPDIERGYVEVPAASSFSIITNTQAGYVIDFRPLNDVFRSVLVTGLPSSVEIGPWGGIATHNVPHGRTTIHLLGYRFMLRPDLQPGSYPWPLALSVRSA